MRREEGSTLYMVATKSGGNLLGWRVMTEREMQGGGGGAFAV
jgi:hypothetical protein